jgi:mannosyltransferase OCH1-like enzyme
MALTKKTKRKYTKKSQSKYTKKTKSKYTKKSQSKEWLKLLDIELVRTINKFYDENSTINTTAAFRKSRAKTLERLKPLSSIKESLVNKGSLVNKESLVNKGSLVNKESLVNKGAREGYDSDKGARGAEALVNIYQTWGNIKMTFEMKNAIAMIKKTNPEFKHHLYNDNQCYSFIKQNFDKEVADAFLALEPGAYKADLWRYCILYINGGIYIDIKFIPVNNFKLIELVNTNTNHYVLELLDENTRQFCLYNGFIVSNAKNPILLQCINQIVDNVKNNYYGVNALAPTGPGLLGNYYLKSKDYKDIDLFMKVIKYRHNIVYNNKPILEEYIGYRNNKDYKKNHYAELWNQHSIYSSKYVKNAPILIKTDLSEENAEVEAEPVLVKTARIIIKDNVGGIVKDMETIKHIIESLGYNVEIVVYNEYNKLPKHIQKPKFKKVQLQILIEHVFVEYPTKLFPADKTFIFVNQEYINDWDVDRMRDKTVIPLCKTHYGLQSLKKLGIHTGKYVGFGTAFSKNISGLDSNDIDSESRSDNIEKIPNLFIHIVGASPLKGTKLLIETWIEKKIKEPLIITGYNKDHGNDKLFSYWNSLHPRIIKNCSLPENIKIQWKKHLDNISIPEFQNIGNVYFFNEKLDMKIINFLQLSADVHMCPSLIEGWGQYIDEGRRTKSVVLVLDAPPMNELINDETGILVKATKGPSTKVLLPYGWTQYFSKEVERLGLYNTYKTTVNDLYECIKHILDMSEKEKRQMGEKAFKKSKEDYEMFSEKFIKVLKDD